jgi:hypothetical protein
VAQVRDRGKALVNTVMNPRVGSAMAQVARVALRSLHVISVVEIVAL